MEKGGGAALYVEELYISNFRSIHELRIPFRKYTVLIGRNNVGKTSIIEALLLLFKIMENGSGESGLSELDPKKREQIRYLTLYENDKPVLIKGKIVLEHVDERTCGDALSKLREVSGLLAELKYIEATVYIEKDSSMLRWGIRDLTVLGYVSRTTKVAAQQTGKKIHTKCSIIENGKIKNKQGYDAIRKLVGGKIILIRPYVTSSQPLNRVVDILSRAPLISEKFINIIENLKARANSKIKFQRELKRIEGGDEIQIKAQYQDSIPLPLFGGGDQVIQAIVSKFLSAEQGSIIVIEEPETHQHPFFVKNLAETLERYSEERNLQIIVTTHSPVFVRAIRRKENIVIVRREITHVHDIGEVPVTCVKTLSQEDAQMLSVISTELGVSLGYPFFVDVVILVEGGSDEILLKKFIEVLARDNKIHNLPRVYYEIISFSRISEKLRPIVYILRKLGVKVFVIVDGDEEGKRYFSQAAELGLKEQEHAFMLKKEDIFCYFAGEKLARELKSIISERFGDVTRNLSSNAKNRLNSLLDEIENKGFNQGGFKDITSIIFHNMDDEAKCRYGNEDLLGCSIKSELAKRMLRYVFTSDDVPSDIKGYLTIIDGNIAV